MNREEGAEFEAFVLDCREKAFSVAYRILGNVEDAGDAVQNAFVKAFKSRRDFRGESAVSTWFHRIVVNASLDVLRRRKAGPPVVGEIPEDTRFPGPAPEERARRNEIAEKVRSAVGGLPERQREVFALKHFEGLSVEEVGRTLGLAEGTVKVHLSRAVHKLREELSGYDL